MGGDASFEGGRSSGHGRRGAACGARGAMAAGPYAIDAHVDGVPNGGNYSPASFNWTDPFEVTFTHTTDATSVALLGSPPSAPGRGHRCRARDAERARRSSPCR